MPILRVRGRTSRSGWTKSSPAVGSEAAAPFHPSTSPMTRTAEQGGKPDYAGTIFRLHPRRERYWWDDDRSSFTCLSDARDGLPMFAKLKPQATSGSCLWL